MRSKHSALLIAAAWGAGCGGDRTGTWIAQGIDGDAWVAVKEQNGAAVAYVCGGASTIATHTRWLTPEGATTDGATRFEEDGWRLDFFVGPPASGTLRSPEGAVTAFTGRALAADGAAGLSTAIDAGCRTGVIVASPEADSAQGAWCDGLGVFAQVTPVLPADTSTGSLTVRAQTPGGPRDIVVHPIDPAELQP
jgi:hypothetical protein